MNDIEKLNQKIENQEKRIEKIENKLNINSFNDRKVEEKRDLSFKDDTNNVKTSIKFLKKNFPSFTFTQIITFLGILGVIIGLVSFFFYAVVNNWIGEMIQIFIGILIGAILFGFGYILHKKDKMWSMFVFGGSLLIEFITIGVGVLEYKVLPEVLGLIILLTFIIISIILSINFNSRIIAYYTLVGGYLVPFLSGIYRNELFVLVYLILISISLLFLSSKYNWPDLRFFSFSIQLIYIFSNIHSLGKDENLVIALIFIVLNFLIYNFTTLIYSVKNSKELNQLDAITMNFNSFFFLIFSYIILENILEFIEFGIYILPLCFLYLLEIYILKKKTDSDFKSIYYSVFSSAIIVLNLSVYFILDLDLVNIDFLMIIFAVEWFMFGYISKIIENKYDINFYKVVSYIFLGLFILWYLYILIFDERMLHATLYLLLLITIIPGIIVLFKKGINTNFYGGFLLIYIFAVIYSFSQYLSFLGFNSTMTNLSLSVMWLIYTLVGIKYLSKNKNAKILLMALLGITLLKIAFNDLLFLDGVYRIIGFTLFGILLLIGGYFLKNETEK